MKLSINKNSEEEIELFLIKDENHRDIFYLRSRDEVDFIKLKFTGTTFNVLESYIDVEDSEEVINEKLDGLALVLIENQQSGTEITDEGNEEVDEDPYDPDKIRVETKSFSLRQIYDMIKNGDIDLTPDFQRNFVWDKTRKSRLIESILLRIPLPIFYFSQDYEGRITVVDGLQRLSTIRDFMDNMFRLKNLEYLQVCDGKSYEGKGSIDTKYFRWFNMTQIVVNVIDPSSPSSVKYDIFRRINTGGKPLNAQEIRNCLASRELRHLLNSMVNLPQFVSTTLGSVKDTRMEAQELALRFITFFELYEEDSLQKYSGSINSTLDSMVDNLSMKGISKFELYMEKFETAMFNAEYVFGDYAFRKCLLKHLEPESHKQLVNKVLFVSWSVLLSSYSHVEIVENNERGCLARPLAERITNDRDFFNFLTYGTNSKANVLASFDVAREILSENLN